MTTLTAADALELFPKANTVEDLERLAANTRVTQVRSGHDGHHPATATDDYAGVERATLPYRGHIREPDLWGGLAVRASDIATAMNAADPGLALIAHSHVGVLLISDQVKLALISLLTRQGLPPTEFSRVLYGKDGVFFSAASRAFASAITGDILAIIGTGDPTTRRPPADGILTCLELTAVLDGPCTKRMNGIPLAERRDCYGTPGGVSGEGVVRGCGMARDVERVMAKSLRDLRHGVEVHRLGNGRLEVRVAPAFFTAAGVGGAPERRFAGRPARKPTDSGASCVSRGTMPLGPTVGGHARSVSTACWEKDQQTVRQ